MLFNCGETFDTRMNRKLKQAEKLLQERRWFAWYPVLLGETDGRQQCVWLEWILRKKKVIFASYTCPGEIYIGQWYYKRISDAA